MELIALAIAPGLAICLFIFYRDAYNREPKRNLIAAFLLGAVTIIPAIFIERALEVSGNSFGSIALSAFLVVALTEELGKFAVLRLYAYSRKSFDEPLDGIVYGVMISMGFATFENIFYVLNASQYGQGYQVAFLRMFLSVPAHATFGVVMGYFAGKAKFDPTHAQRLLFLGLFWAVFFHGIYDFCLFLQGTPDVKEYIADWLLFLSAIASFIVALRLSLKHINLHRRLSQKTWRPTETMSIRKAFGHDIPLIRELADKTWPSTYSSILPTEQISYMLNLMYSEQSLMDQMQKGSEFVMIYDGVQPIGFASVQMLEPGIFKLHKLYVLPSYQGKGTGRFAINEIIKAIKRKGATSLILDVNRNNKAKQFYEKLGFVVTQEKDTDIGNGYWMNDYVMEMKL